MLFLFFIRRCVSSCWQLWGLWPGQLALFWLKAWAQRPPPGSCPSRPAGLFTSPRWRCSRSCWRAAPVSVSLWWRFWPCCSESGWWFWSQSTSETLQSGHKLLQHKTGRERNWQGKDGFRLNVTFISSDCSLVLFSLRCCILVIFDRVLSGLQFFLVLCLCFFL